MERTPVISKTAYKCLWKYFIFTNVFKLVWLENKWQYLYLIRVWKKWWLCVSGKQIDSWIISERELLIWWILMKQWSEHVKQVSTRSLHSTQLMMNSRCLAGLNTIQGVLGYIIFVYVEIMKERWNGKRNVIFFSMNVFLESEICNYDIWWFCACSWVTWFGNIKHINLRIIRIHMDYGYFSCCCCCCCFYMGIAKFRPKDVNVLFYH